MFALMEKKELRKMVRGRLSALTDGQKSAMSESACLKMSLLPQWKAASKVMLFLSMPDEVSTQSLINQALASGKSIYVPKVCGEEIEVYEYSGKLLAPGAFGIMEPSGEAARLPDPKELDFVAVPGVAFTEDGLRMGRGKGFYDRFLPKTSCPRFGLAYSVQIVDSIPSDPWDVPLDGVVTD